MTPIQVGDEVRVTLERLRGQVHQARETAAEIAFSQCATEGKADERTFGQMDAYDNVLWMLTLEQEPMP